MCWKDDNFRLRKIRHLKKIASIVVFLFHWLYIECKRFPKDFNASVATLTKARYVSIENCLEPQMAAATWDGRGSNGGKAQLLSRGLRWESPPGLRATNLNDFNQGLSPPNHNLWVQFLRNLKCSKYDQSIHNKQLHYLYMIKESFWFHQREIKNHIVTNPRSKSSLRSHHNSFPRIAPFQWDLMGMCFKKSLGSIASLRWKRNWWQIWTTPRRTVGTFGKREMSPLVVCHVGCWMFVSSTCYWFGRTEEIYITN